MPGKSNGRNHRNNPYFADYLVEQTQRSAFFFILKGVWRCRTELTITTLIGAAIAWLPVGALIVLGAVLAVALVLPWTRRQIIARYWCVVSRHRLQRLCYETRMHTRSGRVPLILRIKPTKVGERAYVLCRAGICVEDFEAHIGEIRAACYARDARVNRNTRWSQLVTVDIIRHDPLATGTPIPSRLRHHGAPVPSQRQGAA